MEHLLGYIIPKQPIYVYSTYWQTHSRVLLFNNGNYLELNLTPINPLDPKNWKEKVEPKIIRYHHTTGDSKFSKEISFDVYSKMIQYLGEALTKELLCGDFDVGKIDLDLMKKLQNGGIELSKVMR
jgi:hypothetical protein